MYADNFSIIHKTPLYVVIIRSGMVHHDGSAAHVPRTLSMFKAAAQHLPLDEWPIGYSSPWAEPIGKQNGSNGW